MARSLELRPTTAGSMLPTLTTGSCYLQSLFTADPDFDHQAVTEAESVRLHCVNLYLVLLESGQLNATRRLLFLVGTGRGRAGVHGTSART